MSEWIYPPQVPPMEPKLYRSKSKLVAVQEFGWPPALAIAWCFQSSLSDKSPLWYLDADFYHLDAPFMIAEQIVAWQDLPELPHLPGLNEQLKLLEVN